MKIGKLIESVMKVGSFKDELKIQVGGKFYTITNVCDRCGYLGYNGIYLEVKEKKLEEKQ